MQVLILRLVALRTWAAANEQFGNVARCWACRDKPQNSSLSCLELSDTGQRWTHTPCNRTCVVCSLRYGKMTMELKGWSGQPCLGKVGRISEGTGWSTWLDFKRWIRIHREERKRHRHAELTHTWATETGSLGTCGRRSQKGDSQIQRDLTTMCPDWGFHWRGQKLLTLT